MDTTKIIEDLSGLPTRMGLLQRIMPKTEALIIAKSKEFSADDQKLLANRKLKTVDAAILVAANIKGASNIVELINGQDQEVGICSLDKGKIPTGENYSIDKLHIQIANHNSETNPAAVPYFELWGGGDRFAPLTNAEIGIWADNNLLAKIPIAALQGKNQTKHGDFHFEKPILLKSDEQLEIKLEFPKGVSMGTDREYFIRTIWRGVKTTKR